jgi:hypothetical protein
MNTSFRPQLVALFIIGILYGGLAMCANHNVMDCDEYCLQDCMEDER